MPLFPDIFSIQERNRLREESARKDSSIRELTDALANERRRASHADTLIAHHKQLLEKSEQAIRDADARSEQQESVIQKMRDQATAEALRLKEDLRVALNLCDEMERARDAYKETADGHRKEILQLQTELDTTASGFRDRNAEFESREAGLMEKSEKLIAERHALQAQEKGLKAREHNWKVNIEPRLRDLEEHQSLEKKRLELTQLDAALWEKDVALRDLKTDLDRRSCSDLALSRREADLLELAELLSDQELKLRDREAALERGLAALSNRQSGLDLQAEQLNQFQSQVDAIQDNLVELATRERQLAETLAKGKADQEARAAELRERQAALRREAKRVDSLRARLDAREVTVAKQEARQDKLKEERRNFRRQVGELEDENVSLTEQLKHANQKIDSLVTELGSRADRLTFLEGQVASLTLDRNDLKSQLQKCIRSRRVLEDEKTSPIGRQKTEVKTARVETPPPPPPELRANSPLTAHDYRVGATGILDEEDRRVVLEKIIGLQFRNLKKVGPANYMAQWGEANSRNRIWCIAHQLSWNIDFQGAKESLGLARRHWLADLQWLTKHYKGRIPDSHWPKVPRR